MSDAVTRAKPLRKSAPAAGARPIAAVDRRHRILERVAEVPEPQYKVRRRSDGSILPVLFDEDDLREERRRGTWWVQ